MITDVFLMHAKKCVLKIRDQALLHLPQKEYNCLDVYLLSVMWQMLSVCYSQYLCVTLTYCIHHFSTTTDVTTHWGNRYSLTRTIICGTILKFHLLHCNSSLTSLIRKVTQTKLLYSVSFSSQSHCYLTDQSQRQNQDWWPRWTVWGLCVIPFSAYLPNDQS